MYNHIRQSPVDPLHHLPGHRWNPTWTFPSEVPETFSPSTLTGPRYPTYATTEITFLIVCIRNYFQPQYPRESLPESRSLEGSICLRIQHTGHCISVLLLRKNTKYSAAFSNGQTLQNWILRRSTRRQIATLQGCRICWNITKYFKFKYLLQQQRL